MHESFAFYTLFAFKRNSPMLCFCPRVKLICGGGVGSAGAGGTLGGVGSI